MRCLQQSRLSLHKSSNNLRLSSLHTNNDNNLYHLSQRYKVANPKYSRSRQQVEKMDFSETNTGQFAQSSHEDPNYENLDLTLPDSEFLRDMDNELIRNTYTQYNNHWMKNFIKFTDAEFEAFNTKDRVGYAKKPESDVDEVSQSLKYLDEWKQNLKSKTIEDDYQVKLPNGLLIPYSEYLAKLNENEKNPNYSPKKLAAQQRQKYWTEKEPIHDEYGRSHGFGHRKTARASAMVYEGEGNIYIYGKHYSHYFHSYVDRLNVALPFLVTGMDRKMDAWCKVVGGGDSGQSGAIREAIARALANYNPGLYQTLYAFRLNERDWRKRERKKSGKPRARKSVRWKAR